MYVNNKLCFVIVTCTQQQLEKEDQNIQVNKDTFKWVYVVYVCITSTILLLELDDGRAIWF